MIANCMRSMAVAVAFVVCILRGGSGLAMSPRVTVSIDQVGKDYVFFFRRGNEDVMVDYVMVSREEITSRTVPVCTVYAQHPTNPIRNRWVYGDVPAGYQKRGCASLKEGTYHLEMTGGGSGILAFTLDAKGAIKNVR